MNTFWHKLFGIDIPTGKVGEMSLSLRGLDSLGWIIVAGLLLVAATYFLYRRGTDRLDPPRRWLLTILRLIFFLLLLILLLRPVLQMTVEGSVRRTLMILVDDSSSMNIQDARFTPPDRKRAGIALGISDEKDAKLANPSRVQMVRSAMTNKQIKLIESLEKDFDLRAYSFGRSAGELPLPGGFEKLNASKDATALGDVLKDAILRTRGQPLAGIFLATDGQSNAGSPVGSATELAGQQQLPIYTWGVGLPSARDVVVGSIFAPEICFLKDQVPVVVRVRGSGLQGESGQLEVKFAGQKVDQKPIRFDNDGEQVISSTITPDKAGDFEIEASVAPRADEIVKDNNSVRQKIRVIDGKIKALIVEQQPRWEFKYLQALLLRDRRVDAKCVLMEADAGIAGDETGPYLKRFPTSRQELFKFDLLVLGDVDPRAFSHEQLEAINEFVSRFGGGFVMIPGKRFGLSDWKGTAIEKLLPVEIDEKTSDKPEESLKPIPLSLTSAGERAIMLRLSDQEDENRRLWAQLPPVFWTMRISRAKPAAETLLVDPDPSRTFRGQRMPVVAMQQYGLGQSLFVGTDNTWRFRKNGGEVYHAALWGQIVQRMGLPHLLGESKRTQLTSDRQRYQTGDRITLFARLYDDTYSPIRDAQVSGKMSINGNSSDIILRQMPETPGLFRAEFVATSAGTHTFHVDRDPKTELAIDVAQSHLEAGESTMNETLLRQLSENTGGAFLHEEDLEKFPQMLRGKTDLVKSRIDAQIWSSPAYFLLMMIVVTIEWSLRKLWQLK